MKNEIQKKVESVGKTMLIQFRNDKKVANVIDKNFNGNPGMIGFVMLKNTHARTMVLPTVGPGHLNWEELLYEVSREFYNKGKKIEAIINISIFGEVSSLSIIDKDKNFFLEIKEGEKMTNLAKWINIREARKKNLIDKRVLDIYNAYLTAPLKS